MSNSTPTQIYYDLDVVNTFNPSSQLTATNQLNRLTFTEVRSSPILDNPSDYFLSIVRFSLDTAGSMPVMLPQIDLDQTLADPFFPNGTIYYVSMKYNDGINPVIFQKRRVIFVPQSFTQTGLAGTPLPPTFPLNLEKATSPYYWLNSFQYFISMINTALKECYDDIYALISVAPYSATLPADITADKYVYMTWDNDNNKATLNFPNITPFSWKQEPLGTGQQVPPPIPPKLFLYFDNQLYTLFSSFEAILNATYLDPADPAVGINGDKANWFIQNFSKYNTNFVATGTGTGLPPYDILRMTQPYSTGATLSPIQSLVFNTSLLPILPQLIGVPRILRNNITSGQNDNISNEITDLVVNVSRGDEYFPAVLYLPTAEYRLIDLNGNAPISAIQISVQWKDIYGIYHDFFLQNNCNCSLKIMFRRKDQGLD
jgi:hypothetical protein